jgi:multicomponent Na+:H+ antiporter subunit B
LPVIIVLTSLNVMKPTIILKQAAIALIPYQILFALYVQFHGELSVGGGFQAGAILASSFVFYGLVYGNQSLQKVVSLEVLSGIASLGVLVYLLTGVAGMMFGGKFLDYGVLATNNILGQKIGIFIVEWGVGMAVFAVMTMLFMLFSKRVG